jgi:hypothetical protein
MQIGDRVRVEIQDYDRYAMGAAEQLDGTQGAVTEKNSDGVRWLITFDEPCGTWWAHQTPPKAFWFLAEELRVTQRAPENPTC